jgi:hypothetical protein
MVDDSADGAPVNDNLGSIRVQIHRCTVTGPWDGKLTPSTPTSQKPVLVGEKTATTIGDHRVGYTPPPIPVNRSFSAPKSTVTAVKPQQAVWLDSRSGPPYVDFDFQYRSKRTHLLRRYIDVDQLYKMGLISMPMGGKEDAEINQGSAKADKPRSFWSFWGRR